MNLQASLHSHEDVITDLDISKCNKYLATASKDGKIIVWDWKNCQKMDEFNDHRSNVNNVKFFSLVTKVCADISEESIEHVTEEI
jgi:WD40 repeat protein